MLRRYLERIDAATLRERALLFAAAALILVFAVNAIFIKPLRDTQRRLSADIAQREVELRTVQNELRRAAQSRSSDPDAQNRKRASDLRAQLADLDRKFASEQKRFTSPERMRSVLEEMLEREKRLRLVELRTLPVSDLSATQGQAGRRVFRHGVEMTLAGSYLDLHSYLKALEGLSTQLYWGRAEMSVSAYPLTTLKLTVYTLSFDQAWLVV
jgi:MSHA biogenesis protein MshJ